MTVKLKLHRLFERCFRWPLKRWRTYKLHRRFKRWGISPPTDKMQLPKSEYAYVCPFSSRTGGICTMSEKLQETLVMWSVARHDTQDLLLPDVVKLQEQLKEAEKDLQRNGSTVREQLEKAMKEFEENVTAAGDEDRGV